MASSGAKRPHHPDDTRPRDRDDESKRSKPRDWRDAFLEEDQPRRDRDRDRQRERERYRHDERDRRDRRGGSREDGDRPVKDRHRERDHHDHHREREREKGESSRRYGDTRDQRRDYHRGYNRDDPRRSRDREEGECVGLSFLGKHNFRMLQLMHLVRIETSPPKPPTSTLNASPRRMHGIDKAERSGPPDPGPPPKGFHAVSIPTGPKSRTPQTRPATAGPSASTDAFNGTSLRAEEEKEESSAALEEEKDPQTILEERRRKRAEIMAKFQAQGRKENEVISKAGSPAPEGAGPEAGSESVNSTGMKTGWQTGSGESATRYSASDRS